MKFIRNYDKDWELFFARTKDGQVIDFIIQTAGGDMHAFEAKYAIQGVGKAVKYPPALQKELNPKLPLVVVTAGGKKYSFHRILLLYLSQIYMIICSRFRNG